MQEYRYRKNTELVSVPINVTDNDGDPATLATGWTAKAYITTPDAPSVYLVEKTTGFTLADTYPSIIVSWANDTDFASLTASDAGTPYYVFVQITDGSSKTEELPPFQITLTPTLTAAS